MNTYLKMLIIFLCSSPIYFLTSRIFVKAVGFFGNKSSPIKDIGFMLAGLSTAAIILIPAGFGFTMALDNYPNYPRYFIALIPMWFASLTPLVLHIHKNIEIFYSSGYWKRLK